ncbi:MAG: type III polyketide synthase [Chitinophagaceae bacterium]
MSVKIQAVGKALPQYHRKTEEILPFLDIWLADEDERFKRKVQKIFENAGVDKRYSIMSPEEVFTKTSFEDKNNIYSREVKKLGKEAILNVLGKANVSPKEIDYFITVSCTGIMIPSLDAYLINDLEMKQDVVRLPVTEMGCAAGVSGIIYAKNFLKANPNKRALVLAVESPTATFQFDDKSMANVVSAAIFGDGAAAVLLSSFEEDEGVEVIDEQMYHFYNATHLMGFDMRNQGLTMVLDPEVPAMISAHFLNIVEPFLKGNNLEIKDLDHLIFHPGGKKIVAMVEELFGTYGKNIDHTKAVLRHYGNMSSATVLYVLEAFMKEPKQKGDKGLMLSFGPGFSAQEILLEWK